MLSTINSTNPMPAIGTASMVPDCVAPDDLKSNIQVSVNV
jgi:hypothetical protein